jgi:hypothetical protein
MMPDPAAEAGWDEDRDRRRRDPVKDRERPGIVGDRDIGVKARRSQGKRVRLDEDFDDDE